MTEIYGGVKSGKSSYLSWKYAKRPSIARIAKMTMIKGGRFMASSVSVIFRPRFDDFHHLPVRQQGLPAGDHLVRLGEPGEHFDVRSVLVSDHDLPPRGYAVDDKEDFRDSDASD